MHSSGIPIDIEQIRGMPLFSRLEKPTIAHLARNAWIIEHARAARILARGDHLDGLYILFEGRLKLYMLSCNGDERVLRVLGPGDTFGEVIMFNAIPSPVFVDVLSSARLGYFPREIITQALASDPNFTASMLESMGAIMRLLLLDLETCCLQSALQRTANYLLREADAGSPSRLEVELPAAKAVVASMLNISAETFSRELHRLQDEGLIEIDRRTIYLRDRAALVAISNGHGVPAT